jgi:hypothetical protein
MKKNPSQYVGWFSFPNFEIESGPKNVNLESQQLYNFFFINLLLFYQFLVTDKYYNKSLLKDKIFLFFTILKHILG